MANKVCESHGLDREPDCAERTAVLEQAGAMCDLWEETAVVLPSHSRLYHLEPIGVGSPFVESLTSYITRLAEAHSVSIRALIADEISPLWKQIATSHNGYLDRHYLKNFLRVSMVLNGFTTKTSDMVQALEQLTLRQDLRFLTMLTWRNVLSTRKLLKRARAWCPLCYEEWREKGQIVYEPLVWALEDVSICPGHRSKLQTLCPYPDCNLPQSPLAPHSQPGFCSRCSRWLGMPLQSQGERRSAPGNKEWEWEQWEVNAVGELLSSAPSLSIEPQRERMLSSINTYAEKLTSGKMLTLLNQVQYSPRAITSWLYEGVEPQLGSLLHFCFDLGASPFRMLMGEVEEVAVAKVRSKEKPKRQPRKFDTDRLRQALEAVLQGSEDLPPSLKEVARRLEYHPRQLQRHFPDLCRAITARYKASPIFVRQIPEKAARSKTAQKQFRRFDTDRLRQPLEAVLQDPEDPPPSLKEVARRLDADSDQLQRYLPDLSRAISARYDDAMKAMRVKRVQRICDEVRGAVYKIHVQGRYPSMNAVRKRLKAPHVFREPEMLAVWRETMKELGLGQSSAFRGRR